MHSKRITPKAVLAVLLVLTVLVSMLVCSTPLVVAADLSDTENYSDIAQTGFDLDTAEGEELSETGAVHRQASFESLPAISEYELVSDMDGVYLDTEVLDLDINEIHQMTVLDCYSQTVNGRVSFESSNPSVASVSDFGTVIAKSSGEAVITALDCLSGEELSCEVYVGYDVLPTQAPTVAPTDEPEEPTDPPTEPPTQAPTSAPTVAPTATPTQPPTQAPTVAPTSAPVAETLSVKETSATVYVGNYYQVVAASNASVSFSSSNTSVATVDSSGIVKAVGKGTVTITAKTSTKSASCRLTVLAGKSVNISHTSASVYRFKTFLMSSSTSGVKWKSSDTSVATVDNGFVYGAKAGTAVITAYTSSGAATCLMTVNPSRSIRFAYASPNCAAKNQTVTLICITDTMRTGVRFEVGSGSSKKYVNATSKTLDGDTYVWKGTTSFSSAGTYDIKAYSQFNGGTSWTSCVDGESTAFVADSANMTTTVCTKRRASDNVINLIATFEGFSKSAYADVLTGDPTLGYGRVVYTGEQFYNNLTKNEAYAYLVHSVNNEGYADKVNSFLVGNKVKFNQQQFDALVCFVYNVGTGPLYSDDELISAILDCSDGSGSSRSYYISGDYVRIRKGAGTSYGIIDELSYGTSVTVLSTSNSSWYYVQLSDGTKGYVSSDYISYRTTGGNLDLNYVKKQNFINKLCQYHHAGGCIWGLLYRRVDETEMFFYGDYEPNYGNYKYPISFTCARNSSFHT